VIPKFRRSIRADRRRQRQGDRPREPPVSENESSFLVGVAAALATKTKNVGFIGGVQEPLIQKFQPATRPASSRETCIKVHPPAYISQPPDFTGFNGPGQGQGHREGQYDNGADVVYHAAGGSGGGLFQGPRRRTSSHRRRLRPVPDRAADEKSLILTSALKGVDTAVDNFIERRQGSVPGR